MADIDYNDEDAVLAEVAEALGEDPDDLKIDDTGRGLTSFGEGTVYYIQTLGGRRGWCVAEDDDAAREVALAVVRQDLEHEPTLFNKDFVKSHIDIDRLRRDLYSDVQSEQLDYYTELDAEDFWREADGYGMDVPEEDENGEQRDPTDGEIDDLADRATDELLKNPMAYLEDIYGREEAVEQAIKIAGIDIDAAAEEAVDTDGWQHFLGHYDGNSYETASGLVYWRTD